MNVGAVIVGAASLVIIGAFHPIVIKAEYYFSARCWWIFAVSGALLIGTLDRFTYGDPAGYLRNINAYFPTAAQNKLIYIEGTGHTYQEKEQETAEWILDLVKTASRHKRYIICQQIVCLNYQEMTDPQ